MKKGDVLIWQVTDQSYTAKKGAKAIVQKDLLYEDDFVSVEWIRDELSGMQMDGNYFPNYFIKEELC